MCQLSRKRRLITHMGRGTYGYRSGSPLFVPQPAANPLLLTYSTLVLHPRRGRTSFGDQREQAGCGATCREYLAPESGGEVSLAHPQPVNVWCGDEANYMIDLQSAYKLYGEGRRG